MEISSEGLRAECLFSTSRSSGPGGQHVNKTETKVELRFNIADSVLLTEDQKNTLYQKLEGKLADGATTIILTSQVYRSQLKNKADVVDKLKNLLDRLLKKETERKATKPTKASTEKRIASKKQAGEIKTMRGNLKNKLTDDE